MNKVFKFKEFQVAQDRSAMKIGTDAVLLGAWVSLEHTPISILDIGTGTGVIALQLAQRSEAELIDAVEIEASAHHQAVENFENSPWSDRLFCYHAPLMEFAEEIDEQYDLIISNPPFYSNAFASKDRHRNTARLTSALSFDDLLASTSKLLAKQGRFAVIIPFDQEEHFSELARHYKLFTNRILRTKGSPHSDFKRSLIEFSFFETNAEIQELIIENSRHNYTEDYIEIVKDFYLKM